MHQPTRLATRTPFIAAALVSIACAGRPELSPALVPVERGAVEALRHDDSLADGEPASRVASRAPRVDPAEIRDEAYEAQSRFEYFRRRHLPIGYGGSGGRCDAHFGRFCYWYESERPRRPAEPEEITVERARFIALLDSLASLSPADGWIVGEQIRYLIEDERFAQAVGVARSCRGDAGWCAALAGLALHAAGRFAPADSAFRVALASLPEEERCEWTDLSDLLDGDLRKRYRRLDCGEREALQRRIWWLGKPLQMIPGNDLRTEHYARHVMARLQDRTMTPHGRWSRPQEDMMLRYGWARWWTRTPSSDPKRNDDPAISGHELWPSYHHFPSADAVADPARARDDDWRMERPGVPSRYAPRYASPLRPLEHQLVVFERGDSLLVTVAYDARRDAFLWSNDLVAGIVVSDGTGADTPVVARLDDAPMEGVLTATAPRSARLVSVEFMNPSRGAAARARYGLGAPSSDAVRMSKLMLVDAESAGPPATIDEALARALTTTRLYEPRIGVVWEVYGLADAPSAANVSVKVERLPGLGERLAARLRLRDATTPTQIRFPQTFSGTDGAALGALTLDLAQFEPGSYRIEVTVTLPGVAPMTVEREIEIVRLDGGR